MGVGVLALGGGLEEKNEGHNRSVWGTGPATPLSSPPRRVLEGPSSVSGVDWLSVTALSLIFPFSGVFYLFSTATLNGRINFIMRPFHIYVFITNLIVLMINYNSPN